MKMYPNGVSVWGNGQSLMLLEVCGGWQHHGIIDPCKLCLSFHSTVLVSLENT